jgi:hypothetical protein
VAQVTTATEARITIVLVQLEGSGLPQARDANFVSRPCVLLYEHRAPQRPTRREPVDEAVDIIDH